MAGNKAADTELFTATLLLLLLKRANSVSSQMFSASLKNHIFRYRAYQKLSPSPDGSGLAGTTTSPFWILLDLRMTEVVVTTGAITRAKLQSNRHHQQTITQLFLRPNALPVAQPTVPEHRRKSILKTLLGKVKFPV